MPTAITYDCENRTETAEGVEAFHWMLQLLRKVYTPTEFSRIAAVRWIRTKLALPDTCGASRCDVWQESIKLRLDHLVALADPSLHARAIEHRDPAALVAN